MENKPEQKERSFWTTLPGILTGSAALITAVGGLIGGLSAAGVWRQAPEPTPAPVVVVTPTSEATPTVEELIAVETSVAEVASPTPLTQPSPTTIPAASDTRQAKIWALAYQATATGAEGICHEATITVRRKDDSGLRVGFFNENVEGTGPMWRASGWTAVTLSSLLLGVNPEKFEFSFDTGIPYIDGPSAGGLTTIGVLAALLGDTVREDAAMTGTINPDGTIGPVGGIPHKIEGAAQVGKTLVLIPAGQRYDYDDNLRQQIDVVEAGKQLGVEVRQVANLFEAYEILTGKPLPRPQVSGSIEFPARAYDKVRASTKTWLSRYQEARNRFNSLSAEAQAEREPTYGDGQAQLAERALSEGLVAVAHQRAWEAAFDAETNLQAATLDEVYYQQGFEALLDQLRATATSGQEMQGLIESLKAERPRSASEVITLMDGWGNLAVAWGYNLQGDNLFNYIIAEKEKGTGEEDLLDWVYEAAYDYVIASLFLDMTRDALDLGMGFGEAPVPADGRITIMADLLRRAADANLALFDSVVVEHQANQAQVSLDVMKSRYRGWDEDYRDAVYAIWGMQAMEQETWEEPARSISKLGSSLTAWAESAVALAKHYSLGAQMDQEGNVIGLTKESALAEMLDLAESRAEELIKLVRDEDPVLPMHYAENARIMRQGDAPMQLASLYYNWQAAVEAQMLAYFTGTYGEAVESELQQSGRSVELLSLWDLPAR